MVYFYIFDGNLKVDVCDVSYALVKLLFSEIKNERFILNGSNLTYRDCFEKIAVALGKPKAKIKVTPFLKSLAWRIEAIRAFFTNESPLLTKETANSAMKNVSYSSEKVKEKLKYEFISFDKTVKACCRFYRQDLV